MPFNSDARRARAVKQVRDKNGHFIPLKPKVKVSGQANLLAGLIQTEKDSDPYSILTLKMGRPWEKFIQILEDIKKKQSTKVDLKFTIPLVALPIVIIMAFQFGRYQSSCTDHFSPQVGVLQNITVQRNVAPDHWFLKALSYLPFMSGIYDKKETLTQTVLVKADNQGVIIDNEANTNLNPFNQSKVIVFGNYNSCAQTLTLDSDKNISNY